MSMPKRIWVLVLMGGFTLACMCGGGDGQVDMSDFPVTTEPVVPDIELPEPVTVEPVEVEPTTEEEAPEAEVAPDPTSPKETKAPPAGTRVRKPLKSRGSRP